MPAIVSKDVGSIMALLASVATLMVMICSCGKHHSVEAFVTPLTRAVTTSPSLSIQSTLFEQQRATTASSATSTLCNKKISTSLTMMADDGDTAPPTTNTNNNNVIPRDVIIVGGGLAGLSIALRIATTSARHVTIVEREAPRTSTTGSSSSNKHNNSSNGPTTAGSFAAAGMLAPQSERLPAGPLLDICLESRGMYGEWIKGVERGAMEASGDVHRRGEGYKYLWQGGDDDGNAILNGNVNKNSYGSNNNNLQKMEPWETGFHCTGGFLAPAFAGDAVATWSPQPNSGKAYWLDEIQVRELEPMLHPNVIGGWWFPEDASVDARRLTCSLRAACVGAGVQMQFGQEYEVKSLEMSGGKCNGVHLANGKVYQPKSLVVANGSWMRHLLPLPVTPHKGQSFSLRMDANAPPILSRVLFAQDTYIVPKADGRIIVGATVEPGTYDGSITPSGMLHCMSEATRLVPALADLPIEEQWAGLRPTTPDKCPLLGGTEQWDNVYLAGGYWRNGVLLAPKTGQLVGDLIVNDGNADRLPPKDQALLQAFSWERFTRPGGGKALAANARYAATFYPVHKRSTTGIAASVGTELGFYEGAAAAKGDRAKDRQAMFGLSAEDEDALERAAGMGVGDAEAFSFGDENDGWMKRKSAAATKVDDFDMEKISAEPDAFTVGVKEEDEYATLAQEWSDAQTNADDGDDGEEADVNIKSDLSSIYEKIKANKAKASESMEMGEDSSEEREDPGFRIYHVDRETREETEVPPFTSPGEFFEMKEKGTLSSGDAKAPSSDKGGNSEDGPPLFDGYTAIREAYGGRTTEEETAEATRSARMRNRAKVSEIDESKIGALSSPGDSPPPATSSTIAPPPTKKYEKVRSEKAKAWVSEMNGSSAEGTANSLDDGSDEKTYDGYQAIMSANASSSRKEELAKMKEARMANRAKADRIDSSFKL